MNSDEYRSKKIIKLGQAHVDGSQSGFVYSWGVARPSSLERTDTQSDTSWKYALCDKICYCIDANYAKGTTLEGFITKHRRQLVIECE